MRKIPLKIQRLSTTEANDLIVRLSHNLELAINKLNYLGDRSTLMASLRHELSKAKE